MTRPGAAAAKPAVPTELSHANAGFLAPTQGESVLSDFDQFCLERVTQDSEKGWASELHSLSERSTC
jgi:hypothetical protein